MKTLSMLKKGAIALSLAAGFAGTAQAGSLAQSVLQLNNLTFRAYNGTNIDSSPILNASFFSGLTIRDTTSLLPSLNGVNNAYVNSTTGGVPLGQNVVCVPTSCPSFMQPSTPFANIPTPAAGNGSMAASNLTGAPIAGLGTSTPATAQVSALSELVNTGNAITLSNLSLQSSFQFTIAAPLAFAIDFNTMLHLIATNSVLGGQAQSSSSWNINIVNNNDPTVPVFSWSPNGQAGGIFGGTELNDQCNMNQTVGITTVNTATADCSGRETAFVALASGSYALQLTHNDNTSVVLAVPEPEVVALMGIGLVGLGLSQRRRSKKA